MNQIKTNNKKQFLFLTAFVVAWIGLHLLNSFGNEFPLNDDWSYSFTVKELIEHHHIRLTNWMSGPLVTQTLWGYLFCLPFGFSFTALRISTIIVAAIGIVFSYKILLITLKKPYYARAGIFLLAANPLYFSLSETFMTDIHFFTWFTAGLYYFIKYVKDDKTRYWIAGSVFSVMAMLTRQFGLVLPLSFLIFFLIFPSQKQLPENREKQAAIKRYNKAIRLLISFVFTIGFFMFFTHLLEAKLTGTAHFRSASEIFDLNLDSFFFRIYKRIGFIFTEAGFWLLPLTIPVFINNLPNIKTNAKWLVPLTVVFILPFTRVFALFPSGNIVNYFYIGPLTTFDTYILNLNTNIFSMGSNLLLTLRILVLLSGIILFMLFSLQISNLIKNLKQHQNDFKTLIQLILIITGILYSGIIMINLTYFDRYSIPLLFLMLVFILQGNTNYFKKFRVITFTLILIVAVFSISETRHYLIRSKTKWKLAQYAVDRGFTPSEIDGGHEYNGWNGQYINGHGKWDTSGKKAMISYSPIKGYRVLTSKTYHHPLFSYPVKMYLLEKQ
jgi:hypothetical protein